MYDTILENALLFDALRPQGRRGDVAIKGERIAGVGDCSAYQAVRRFDLSGLVLCPGFIDVHSHSDQTLFLNGSAESKVRQGVTTEVIGNCGFSAAPSGEDIERCARIDDWLEGRSWPTLSAYFHSLEGRGTAVNVISLVGHNNLCSSFPDSREEFFGDQGLRFKEDMLVQAMEEGAAGLSSGLVYPPGCFSSTNELVALAKILREYRGIYTTHLRDEGKDVFSALQEAIEIGQAAGVPVHVSHHKLVGEKSGRAYETLAMMDEARSEGLDITCDVYPYLACNTGLTRLLPHWALAGSLKDTVLRLKDAAVRQRIRKEMESTNEWSTLLDQVHISYSKRRDDYTGRSITGLAEEEMKDPYDLIFDLIVEDEGTSTVNIFQINESDLIKIISHPLTLIGSDGYALSREGILCRGWPHPRSFGTFPRLLEKYVREQSILSLGEAIIKMTFLPARRFHLRGRGLIKEGYYADLVSFDAERVAEGSSYLDPYQYPRGIELVLVNGSLVLQGEKHTGELKGKVLRFTPSG